MLVPQSNAILTALVYGMRKDEKDNIRLAATTALYNSLEFTKNNFQNDVYSRRDEQEKKKTCFFFNLERKTLHHANRL